MRNPLAGAARHRAKSTILDGVVAGAIAGALSGAPSTVHAIATGANPLEASLAAGSLLFPREHSTSRLLIAAVPVHFALSIGWGIALAAALPRRATSRWGAVAGLAIAAIDLGLVGSRYPRIASLAAGPQVADHLAYGAIVGAMLYRRRANPSPSPRQYISDTPR